VVGAQREHRDAEAAERAEGHDEGGEGERLVARDHLGRVGVGVGVRVRVRVRVT